MLDRVILGDDIKTKKIDSITAGTSPDMYQDLMGTRDAETSSA
jgi:hypothetical protein